jgi:hypothetical protein
MGIFDVVLYWLAVVVSEKKIGIVWIYIVYSVLCKRRSSSFYGVALWMQVPVQVQVREGAEDGDEKAFGPCQSQNHAGHFLCQLT